LGITAASELARFPLAFLALLIFVLVLAGLMLGGIRAGVKQEGRKRKKRVRESASMLPPADQDYQARGRYRITFQWPVKLTKAHRH
jgi:hypothetical protein